MKSLYSFIVKPLDERYDNIRKVEEKELIINTSIENLLKNTASVEDLKSSLYEIKKFKEDKF